MKSPAASVVEKNVATLFCREAQKCFGATNFSGLAISTRVRNKKHNKMVESGESTVAGRVGLEGQRSGLPRCDFLWRGH